MKSTLKLQAFETEELVTTGPTPPTFALLQWFLEAGQQLPHSGRAWHCQVARLHPIYLLHLFLPSPEGT